MTLRDTNPSPSVTTLEQRRAVAEAIFGARKEPIWQQEVIGEDADGNRVYRKNDERPYPIHREFADGVYDLLMQRAAQRRVRK